MKLYEIHKMGESLELCERLNILQNMNKQSLTSVWVHSIQTLIEIYNT